MKISQLIKKLQDIDSTVPFDSDVVTGDDWMPSAITRVYHEPPRTFIEFEASEDELLGEDFNSFSREWTEQEVAMRQSFIKYLFTCVQNGDASAEDAAKYIDLLMDRTLNCGTDAGVDFMKQFAAKS
ncbi:hypothetical protein [Vibrio mimicus]|uniref:Uncharacterized protein n=1 Tax=Vibrio mimicus TaxID=674 RepID=A0A2J9VLL5_VIBMI|nr:hypothetical protein [Vibrio mimicus]EGR2895054.1 hypothetical protein [Vibrio parahaemolyticus]EEW08875.1 hypothetical protein VMD_36420 [Vibrio mimicus VM573]EGR2933665.1 hypothetical protein [Vibrio parahaemolyticus]EGR2958216.1 hypothetical protein [Vibrio parahaemolyticus]EGR2963068.1 hypothetical protein [Vibrio parahaemolyticus]